MDDIGDTDVYNKFYALIEEYEDIIKSLTRQLDGFKEEHAALKSDFTKILSENDNLNRALHDFAQKANEAEQVDNLKEQLQCALQEKNYISELWQTSLKTIDHLEQQLLLSEGKTHGFLHNEDVKLIKADYERQIEELKKEVNTCKQALHDVLQTAKKEIDNKSLDLKNALQEQKCLVSSVSTLQNELKELKSLQDDNIAAKYTLKTKDVQINMLNQKLLESNNKISEACSLVESAILEKDAALLRENQAKEEFTQINKLLNDVIMETEEKVKNELELANTKYEVKLSKYKMEIENRDETLGNANQEIHSLKKHVTILEKELSLVQKGNICLEDSNTSKLLVLEKNLESTFQKLMISEKKLIHAASDRDELKNDLERMSSAYEKDIKEREIEKCSFIKKIKRLEHDLENSHTSLKKVSNNVSYLNERINSINNDMEQRSQLIDRNVEKQLSYKVCELQKLNKQMQEDLKQKLSQQLTVNKRYKVEFEDVTEKLQSRLKKLKTESGTLKKVNKELASQLNMLQLEANEYKSNLEKLCSEVNNVVASSFL